MSIIRCTLFLVFCFGYTFLFGQTDSSKIADIKKLIEVSGTAKTIKMSTKAMLDMMKQNTAEIAKKYPDVPVSSSLTDEMWAEIEQELNVENLLTMYIPIYEKHFTQDEIKYMIAFYESPTGKSMIEKMPLVMNDSMSIGREWSQKLMQRLLEKLKKK